MISVYETDGYQAIMGWIEAESGVGWRSLREATKAHRIIADHGRGMTFFSSPTASRRRTRGAATCFSA